MIFEIKDGLMAEISEYDNTATIVHSPKATGNIFIPHFFEKDNKKYKITNIRFFAFSSCKFDSLTFPEDSEIEFDVNCFDYAHYKKLQIPPKVKNIIRSIAEINELDEIEISRNNHHLILFNNQFILSKSNDDIDKFDVLQFCMTDVEEAVIPAQISIIESKSFFNRKLKSIKFETNSELKIIGFEAFFRTRIEDLIIPASVEMIGEGSFLGNPRLKSVRFPSNSKLKKINDRAFESCNLESISIPASVEYLGTCFGYNDNLFKIEISPENKFFKLIDGNYIVMESEHGSGVFDTIFFCRRNVESIMIPSYIKVIKAYAFESCKQLKNITFEPNSSLELIENYAFSENSSEKLVFPPSLKKIGCYSLQYNHNLKYVEFLGKYIEIGYCCFYSSNISTIIFTNADQIIFGDESTNYIPDNAKILVRKNAQLSGVGLNYCKSKIHFIEEFKEPKTIEKSIKAKKQTPAYQSRSINLEPVQQCHFQWGNDGSTFTTSFTGYTECSKTLDDILKGQDFNHVHAVVEQKTEPKPPKPKRVEEVDGILFGCENLAVDQDEHLTVYATVQLIGRSAIGKGKGTLVQTDNSNSTSPHFNKDFKLEKGKLGDGVQVILYQQHSVNGLQRIGIARIPIHDVTEGPNEPKLYPLLKPRKFNGENAIQEIHESYGTVIIALNRHEYFVEPEAQPQ
ncbi:hypothetical protein M9Y10_010684 [Tritrichomonas musculus]|uniref:C2 domain-containing protein n=1 Tax=Tritrichomonas musculus TaxID=1915356 RepID=A0ABR2ILH0_9EUKA